MKWEGIVFDWAGTTVDFGSMAPVEVFKAIFEEKGIVVNNEEVRKPMGMLKWDHIKTMLAMPRIEALWEAKYGKAPEDHDADELFHSFEPKLLHILAEGTALKPYVKETVAELRQRGYQLGSTTGYTDTMMEPVRISAEKAGYAPDAWVTPDAVNGKGRPYPYIIYKNMEMLGWKTAGLILKVGDTVADIEEGKNAGTKTAGILIGSSVMGLTEKEYMALSAEDKEAAIRKAEAVYYKAGADYVFRDIRDILAVAD